MDFSIAADRSLSWKKTGKLLIIDIVASETHGNMDELAAGLGDLCSEIPWDEEIVVVVLSGIERISFPPRDKQDYQGWEFGTFSLTSPIAMLQQPTIAAINGDAVGVGLELALACDLRYASTSSRLGLPHIQNGVIPCEGGTQRLPRIVGRAKALEMILTGEMLSASEACRLGIVTQVLPSDELMKTTIGIAQEMAAKAPIALNYTKEAIMKGMDMTLEQALCLEADLYFLLQSTEDRSEGVKAFREKRNALFMGK